MGVFSTCFLKAKTLMLNKNHNQNQEKNKDKRKAFERENKTGNQTKRKIDE